MKIKGVNLSDREPEYLVIPRGKQDIVFTICPVLSFDEFDKLCPEPKPPIIQKRGGVKVEDSLDKSYRQRLVEHNSKRMAWMILQGIRDTEGLEWDQVNYDDPETWPLYEEELKAANFNQGELTAIVTAVVAANSLSDETLKEAKERFLAARQELQSEQ